MYSFKKHKKMRKVNNHLEFDTKFDFFKGRIQYRTPCIFDCSLTVSICRFMASIKTEGLYRNIVFILSSQLIILFTVFSFFSVSVPVKLSQKRLTNVKITGNCEFVNYFHFPDGLLLVVLPIYSRMSSLRRFCKYFSFKFTC